jgi:type II secretory pathway pseudopilin PulG
VPFHTVRSERGYTLLAVMIGVIILSIFLTMAAPLWEAERQRDLEEEYFFRARQYVQAIETFQKNHGSAFPQNLEVLHLEKFLRKMYADPLGEDGRWNLVMRDVTAGQKLLLVPDERKGEFLGRAVIIGVCSRSPLSGYREYRGKIHYNEWAVYLGDDPEADMPELGGPAGAPGKE